MITKNGKYLIFSLIGSVVWALFTSIFFSDPELGIWYDVGRWLTFFSIAPVAFVIYKYYNKKVLAIIFLFGWPAIIFAIAIIAIIKTFSGIH